MRDRDACVRFGEAPGLRVRRTGGRRDRWWRIEQRGRVVRDAGGGVAVRRRVKCESIVTARASGRVQALRARLPMRELVQALELVVVVVVADDRAVDRMRVMAIVRAEVHVRQDLDPQQP